MGRRQGCEPALGDRAEPNVENNPMQSSRDGRRGALGFYESRLTRRANRRSPAPNLRSKQTFQSIVVFCRINSDMSGASFSSPCSKARSVARKLRPVETTASKARNSRGSKRNARQTSMLSERFGTYLQNAGPKHDCWSRTAPANPTAGAVFGAVHGRVLIKSSLQSLRPSFSLDSKKGGPSRAPGPQVQTLWSQAPDWRNGSRSPSFPVVCQMSSPERREYSFQCSAPPRLSARTRLV